MKKTNWGQIILEPSDIANLPLLSENAQIVETEVNKLIQQIQDGQISNFEELTQEIKDIQYYLGLMQVDKMDKNIKDENNGRKYTLVMKNGELYKREVTR